MEDDERKPSGCGLLLLYNNVFRRPPPAPRRSASTNSLPTHGTAPSTASDAHSSSKRRRSTSDDPSTAVSGGPAPLNSKAFANPNYPKAPASTRPTPMQGLAAGPRRAHNGGGISMELDSMINDHQRTKGSSTLVRASSGNVMLYGNLGNLRAPGAVTPSRNVLDYLPKTVNEMNSNATNRTQQGYGGMNGPNPMANSEACAEPDVPGVMCRALSTRLDPEELKEMGNEEYKQGNFAEAVALYDRAILINPEKASYWSNKAAALTAMGRLIEAVAECREAVRIDPSYHRAHHRLGTLYLR